MRALRSRQPRERKNRTKRHAVLLGSIELVMFDRRRRGRRPARERVLQVGTIDEAREKAEKLKGAALCSKRLRVLRRFDKIAKNMRSNS